MNTQDMKLITFTKLSLIFGEAGTLDKLITRARISLNPTIRQKLVSEFHERWERKAIAEINEDSAFLEKSSGREDLVLKRRDSIEPRLDFARNNKEIVLRFGR